MGVIAERLAEAIEQLESLREENEDLRGRLGGALGADPAGRARAHAWIGRAKLAEAMLRELTYWVDQNPSVRDLLPTGFDSRVRAQLRAVEIRSRDSDGSDEVLTEEWWEAIGKDDIRIVHEADGTVSTAERLDQARFAHAPTPPGTPVYQVGSVQPISYITGAPMPPEPKR